MTNPNEEHGLPKGELDSLNSGVDMREHLADEPMTVAEFLRQPVIAEYYPWEVNPFSPTPFGRKRIEGKGYYFPALRYQIRRLEKNTAKISGIDNAIAAALEELNHAHAQACAYSDNAMDSLLMDPSANELMDDVTLGMMDAAGRGHIDVAESGLLLLAYPAIGSMEGANDTVAFAKSNFKPFDEHVADKLAQLKDHADNSKGRIKLELINPEDQGSHLKQGNSPDARGVYVSKHPIVELEKRTIARLTGSLRDDGETHELELVVKQSSVSEEYQYLLASDDTSLGIKAQAYWRDVRTKKSTTA
jgi:hypothetical protein